MRRRTFDSNGITCVIMCTNTGYLRVIESFVRELCGCFYCSHLKPEKAPES